MTDRESVIIGLQNCRPSWFTVEKCSDDSCPYNQFGHEDGGCVDHLIDDVLELLKEQAAEIERLERDLAVVRDSLYYYVNGKD